MCVTIKIYSTILIAISRKNSIESICPSICRFIRTKNFCSEINFITQADSKESYLDFEQSQKGLIKTQIEGLDIKFIILNNSVHIIDVEQMYIFKIDLKLQKKTVLKKKTYWTHRDDLLFTGNTMIDRLVSTRKMTKEIQNTGYAMIEIWEREFDEEVRTNAEFKRFSKEEYDEVVNMQPLDL